MKKVLVVLLIVFLIVSLTGCSDPREEVKLLEKQLVERTTDLLESISSEISTKLPKAEYINDTLSETKESKTTNVGNIENPGEFNKTILVNGDYLGQPIVFNITLYDFVRGDKALQKMESDNQLNEVGNNEEPVYFKVKIEVTNYDNKEDDAVYISILSFGYIKSDYKKYSSSNILIIEDQLLGKVYEGDTIEGTVGLIVPKNDSGYILYNNSLWFKMP